MHNGEIAAFKMIKRQLHAVLSDEIFHSVKGNTGAAYDVDGLFPPLIALRQIRNGLLPCFSQRCVCCPAIEDTN
jgi:hypothetical protein